MSHLTISNGKITSEFSLKNSADQVYVLSLIPSIEQKNEVSKYLNQNMYLLDSQNYIDTESNWKVISRIFKDDIIFFSNIFNDLFKEDNIVDLNELKTIAQTNNLNKFANHIEQIIKDFKSEPQQSIDYLQISLNNFNCEKSGKENKLLSCANLSDKSFFYLMKNLGNKYDLTDLLDIDIQEEKSKQLNLYIDIVEILQQMGMANIGLPEKGQISLNSNNQKSWSKNTLVDLFINPQDKEIKSAPEPKIKKISGAFKGLEKMITSKNTPIPVKKNNIPISVKTENLSIKILVKLANIVVNYLPLHLEEVKNIYVELNEIFLETEYFPEKKKRVLELQKKLNELSLTENITKLHQEITNIYLDPNPNKFLKDKKGTLEKTWGKLARIVHSFLLSEDEYRELNQGHNKYNKYLENPNRIRLYDWQDKVIKMVKNGLSLLVNGPTSGGKTYISMIVFQYLLEEQEIHQDNRTVVYIAPTFHLALQVCANVTATFPNLNCNFITGIVNKVSINSNVWIGTPSAIYNYFKSIGKTFQIVIFDEIHSISTSFASNTFALKNAEAISHLLTLFKDIPGVNSQLLALSATIKQEDLNSLRDYISEKSGIPINEIIRYGFIEKNGKEIIDRKIFLNKYVYDGFFLYRTNYTEDESSKNKEINPDENDIIPITKITDQSTFNFFLKMKEAKMFPALIFSTNDKDCYDTFNDYINWVENVGQPIYFKNWIWLFQKFKQDIDYFNTVIRGSDAEDYINAFNRNSGPALAETTPRARTINTERTRLRDNITQTLEKIIREISTVETEYMVLISKGSQEHGVFGRVFNNIPDNFYLNCECVDLLSELYIYQKDASDELFKDFINVENLTYVCDGIPQFFKFGDKKVDNLDIIKEALMGLKNTQESDKKIEERQKDLEYYKMNSTKKGAAKIKIKKGQNSVEKMRTDIQKLCKDENIDVDDIKELFKVMINGLEYGVGIILPTMPIAVQSMMLEILSTKTLSCTLVSHSMSQGINYPVDTVVIMSKYPIDLNISEIMQMEGRAGRSGFEKKFGNLITINITNILKASLQNLPKITFPVDTNFSGLLIPNSKNVAVEIDAQRLFEGIDIKMIEEYQNKFDKNQIKINDPIIDRIIHIGISQISILLENDPNELVNRVINILKGIINPTMSKHAYYYAEKIDEIKMGLLELYIQFIESNNTDWLDFIKLGFQILHRCQYKQMGIKN